MKFNKKELYYCQRCDFGLPKGNNFCVLCHAKVSAKDTPIVTLIQHINKQRWDEKQNQVRL